MWWSKSGRRAVLAVLPGFALLGGCGFRPLYAESPDGNPVTADRLRAIDVPEAESILGFEVRNALLQQFNPGNRPTSSQYRLQLQLSEADVDLAVQPDATVTRRDLIVSAIYGLLDLSTGETVHRGVARRRSSFNVTFEPYAVLVAEQDAQRRAARELAVVIRQDIVGYFERDEA